VYPLIDVNVMVSGSGATAYFICQRKLSKDFGRGFFDFLLIFQKKHDHNYFMFII
jgi:hypothetical protein